MFVVSLAQSKLDRRASKVEDGKNRSRNSAYVSAIKAIEHGNESINIEICDIKI